MTVFFYMLRGFQFAAIPRKKAKRRASGIVRLARRSCSACGRTAFGRLRRPTGFCLRQKPARRACRGAAGVEGAGGRLERSESRVMCERAGRITVERFSLIMRGRTLFDSKSLAASRLSICRYPPKESQTPRFGDSATSAAQLFCLRQNSFRAALPPDRLLPAAKAGAPRVPWGSGR